MSKLIASAAIRGANTLANQAEEMLEKAIAKHGADYKFEFPDTAFYLPMVYAMTAFPVKTLEDMRVASGMPKKRSTRSRRSTSGSPTSGRRWTPGWRPSLPRR